MKTTICLMRHGQTDWNKLSLIQGKIDNPLNETGKKQAIEIGTYLINYDPNWDIIISSPLSRAYETCFIVSKMLAYNQEIIKETSVIEREFGALEGAKVSIESYELMFAEQVEGLESLENLKNRAYLAILEIAKKYEGKKILIATHSQFIKGLIVKIDSSFDFRFVLKNTSLNYFTYENNELTIEKLNITNEKH